MQNKPYNRTLFVAALSVYLGLLIVGAPPQVLAQQSLQQFSKHNSENKSDCLKPETDEILELVNSDYGKFLSDYLESIKEVISAENYNLDFKSHFHHKFDNRECSIEGCYLDESKIANLSPESTELLRQATYRFLTGFLPNKQLNFDGDESAGIRFHIDESSLRFETIVNKYFPRDAQPLVNNLEKAFAIKICKEKNESAKQVYQNTKVSFRDNQIFIVTRLPRAGLDALLKADERTD